MFLVISNVMASVRLFALGSNNKSENMEIKCSGRWIANPPSPPQSHRVFEERCCFFMADNCDCDGLSTNRAVAGVHAPEVCAIIFVIRENRKIHHFLLTFYLRLFGAVRAMRTTQQKHMPKYRAKPFTAVVPFIHLCELAVMLWSFAFLYKYILSMHLLGHIFEYHICSVPLVFECFSWQRGSERRAKKKKKI